MVPFTLPALSHVLHVYGAIDFVYDFLAEHRLDHVFQRDDAGNVAVFVGDAE